MLLKFEPILEKLISAFNISLEHAVSDIRNKEQLQVKIILWLLFPFLVLMTFINLFSGNIEMFLVLTAAFILVTVSLAFVHLKNNTTIPKIITVFLSFALFLYFVITGGIEGVSILWVFIGPTAYMFFLGFQYGVITNLVLFTVIAILLWSPLNQYLLYNYGSTFFIRFPIILFCSLSFAFAQEFFRHITYLKLLEARTNYETLSKLDPLTGVYNRRSLNELIEFYWDMVKRSNTDLSIILLDIDRFKSFNDHYGHLEGDRVLKSITEEINKALTRSTDALARFGGEEFVILLPFTELKGALNIANSIRNSIVNLNITHAEKEETQKVITVSLGVASLNSSKAETKDQLLSLADNAMYEAKRLGRNTVMAASDIN